MSWEVKDRDSCASCDLEMRAAVDVLKDYCHTHTELRQTASERWLIMLDK